MPFAPSGPELLRGLQERTARALPAEQVTEVDGWWLRHDRGAAWWAATVLPHREVEPNDLVGRVAAAEEFYAEHGAPARFQISPGVCPDGLDAVLAERGYRLHSPMSVQVTPTARIRSRFAGRQLPAGSARGAEPLRVRVDDHATDAWFDTWDAVHGHGGDAGPEWAMLDRVEQPSGYASVVLGDQTVAVGRAVADTGWVGLFGMATRPDARGRGAAGAVVAALADWAETHAADHMYLQVQRENIAACRLYERIGFTQLCEYHYRIAT